MLVSDNTLNCVQHWCLAPQFGSVLLSTEIDEGDFFHMASTKGRKRNFSSTFLPPRQCLKVFFLCSLEQMLFFFLSCSLVVPENIILLNTFSVPVKVHFKVTL